MEGNGANGERPKKRVSRSLAEPKPEAMQLTNKTYYEFKITSSKNDTEGANKRILLDMGVGMVGQHPSEPHEDEQGEDVDEEPDRLQEDGVADLMVGHVEKKDMEQTLETTLK